MNGFVSEWRKVLWELGHSLSDQAPSKAVRFCVFVAAVRAHTEHRSWPLYGKDFDMDSPSLVTDAIGRFVSDEEWRKANTKLRFAAQTEQRRSGGMFYCPYHERRVKHRPEDCRLNSEAEE